MRNKNSNTLSNAWRKFNRAQRKYIKGDIFQTVSTQARSGMSYRNGQLEAGSTQLFNLLPNDYITFGGNNGSKAIVGP